MPMNGTARESRGGAWPVLGVALGMGTMSLAVLSWPVQGRAESPPLPAAASAAVRQQPGQVQLVPTTDSSAEWRWSLSKAVTYQTIVVTTDQLLYWAIVEETPESELEFFFANALTGIGYYVEFDKVWTTLGLDPAPGENAVSVRKALAYRVFDTARVFVITVAIGTPIAASLEVTAAIAATRTVTYMLHDYAWSWATSP